MGLYQQVKELRYKISFIEEGLSKSDLYSIEPGQKILIRCIVGVRLISFPCLFEAVDERYLQTYYYFPPFDVTFYSSDATKGAYYIPDYDDVWSVQYPIPKVSKYDNGFNC